MRTFSPLPWLGVHLFTSGYHPTCSGADEYVLSQLLATWPRRLTPWPCVSENDRSVVALPAGPCTSVARRAPTSASADPEDRRTRRSALRAACRRLVCPDG